MRAKIKKRSKNSQSGKKLIAELYPFRQLNSSQSHVIC